MPPRRRRSRASQKETDERLSIAETIAGLANSIEQPALSAPGIVTHRNNSDDDKAAADFARLPSMVIEELDSSAALPASLHSLPASAHGASVDDPADPGHTDVPRGKARSQAERPYDHKQSYCSVSDVMRGKELASTVHAPVTSDHAGSRLHADPVAVPLSSDTVYSAVLMGWNPPVLAGSVEPVSPEDFCSPLLALRTVDQAAVNSSSSVEVVKLPLVFEQTSDGVWQLLPVSPSATVAVGVLPTREQHSEQSLHAGESWSSPVLSNSVAKAVVGTGSVVSSESVTSVDNRKQQLHMLGSLRALGNCYNGPRLSGITGGKYQELSGTVNSDSVAGEPSSELTPSSEDAITASLIPGSLGALRDYYKRISLQRGPVAATDVQIPLVWHSPTTVTPVRNSYSDTLHSKVPVVSTHVSNEHVVQLAASTCDVSTANSADEQTDLNMKSVLLSCADDAIGRQSVRTTGRILPSVSDDEQQASSDSTSKPVINEFNCNLQRSDLVPELLTEAQRCEHSSTKRACKLQRHLPPKKRQKVSSSVHFDTEQNGYQQRIADNFNSEQTVGDSVKNADAPDVLLNEEIVVHTENSLSSTVADPGI